MVPVLRVPGDPLPRHPRQPLGHGGDLLLPGTGLGRGNLLVNVRCPVLSLIPERHRHQRGSGLSASAAGPPMILAARRRTRLRFRSRSGAVRTAGRPGRRPIHLLATPHPVTAPDPTAKAHPAGRPRSHRLTRMRRFLSRVGLGCRVVSGHRRVSRRPDRGGEAMSAGPQEFPGAIAHKSWPSPAAGSTQNRPAGRHPPRRECARRGPRSHPLA
jgi:hypothetical protein